MTDPTSQESYPDNTTTATSVPDPTIVDPSSAVRNGQCAQDGFANNHHPPKRASQPDPFMTGQEMKISDNVEGEGIKT